MDGGLFVCLERGGSHVLFAASAVADAGPLGAVADLQAFRFLVILDTADVVVVALEVVVNADKNVLRHALLAVPGEAGPGALCGSVCSIFGSVDLFRDVGLDLFDGALQGVVVGGGLLCCCRQRFVQRSVDRILKRRPLVVNLVLSAGYLLKA